MVLCFLTNRELGRIFAPAARRSDSRAAAVKARYRRLMEESLLHHSGTFCYDIQRGVHKHSGAAISMEGRAMDMADFAIEGAGVALLAVVVGGAFAIAAERRRVVLGACLGLGIGLLLLPFIAYLVARLTHHLATQADLTPPLYIIITALACAGLGLLGTLIGLLAEARRRRNPSFAPRRAMPSDADYIDDPSVWIPWMRPKDPPAQ